MFGSGLPSREHASACETLSGLVVDFQTNTSLVGRIKL
jgi:hypothetical protein